MHTQYAEDAGQRWAKIDPSFENDDVLSTGILIGILARHRNRLLAEALVTFGNRGVRNMEDYRLLALSTRLDPRPTNASDASKVLGISKAATAVRFERFEKVGLVERTVREFDKRIIEVRVSEVGRKLAIECTHAVKAAYAEILISFDERELAEFRALLQEIPTSR